MKFFASSLFFAWVPNIGVLFVDLSFSLFSSFFSSVVVGISSCENGGVLYCPYQVLAFLIFFCSCLIFDTQFVFILVSGLFLVM